MKLKDLKPGMWVAIGHKVRDEAKKKAQNKKKRLEKKHNEMFKSLKERAEKLGIELSEFHPLTYHPTAHRHYPNTSDVTACKVDFQTMSEILRKLETL